MEKFKGKYRIPSTRWAQWDYGLNAAYFVTICTARHSHDFGEIAESAVRLTSLGQAALECWNEIPTHFPFVELDEFVVMPNHVHGIIVIDKPVETQNLASLPRDRGDSASLPVNKFGPQSKNLASIVRGYKIGVTKFARHNGIPFLWQARYHDHIIRNAIELARIQKYICENPETWATDTFYNPPHR